jgi:hypothetical protein
VVLVDNPGHTTLSVRVTADGGLASVRGMVGAGQGRPEFLGELNRSLRLSFDDGDTEPRALSRWDIERFVREVLLSETREHPIALVAPLEEGGYVVPPAELADELIGLAHLYVMDRHETTFVLTDSVGDKRLSCYWGALRVYMPEFSCADRPENHPLLVRERVLDPVIRAGLVGTLGRFAGGRVRLPTLVERVSSGPSAGSKPLDPPATPSVVTLDEPSLPATPSSAQAGDSATVTPPMPQDAASVSAPTLTAPPTDFLEPLRVLAPVPALLAGLGTQIEALAATITHLVESNAALRDEIERLRTTNAVRAASTGSLERRIGGLEQLLEERLPGPGAPSLAPETTANDIFRDTAGRADEDEEEDEAERLSVVDVLRQATTTHADALLFLDAAERSAVDSPYEDVDRLAVILNAMAAVARRRQEGALGTSLKEAFRDLGIDYRGGIAPSTSEKHRRQDLVRGSDGHAFDCREHIVLGNSYDPRHCLRVYFTSRAPLEPRFVIGHVGRHFDVATTS